MLLVSLFFSGMCFAEEDQTAYAKGRTAYQNGDMETALRYWRPLAEQGNANMQFILGNAYYGGLGVKRDDKEAVAWFRKSAEQDNADAQNSLGRMYENGWGVPKSQVVAYALYDLSATGKPYEENEAIKSRVGLAESMTDRAIEAARALIGKMKKPGNLLKAIDQYIKNPALK